MNIRFIKKDNNNNNNNNNNNLLEPFLLSSNYFLDINNIYNIDELLVLTSDKNINYYILSLIIDSWVRLNLSLLKKYNKFSINICENIYLKYIKDIGKKDNIKDLNKNCHKFLKKWIPSNKQNNFHINFSFDLINFLNKIYD